MTKYSTHSPFKPGVTSDELVNDSLIAGSLQLVTDTVVIGQHTAELVRGTVLGRNSTTKAFVPCVKTATDGSQTPIAILVDDIDTRTVAKNGGIYQMGEFNKHQVIIDPSWTIDDIAHELSKSTIYLKDVMKA